ncbi:hypothetical protein [Streptomyces sp. NPDC055287]
MAGRQYAVEEPAYQGAALFALFRFEGGAFVEVGLGDGPDDAVVRLEQQVDER